MQYIYIHGFGTTGAGSNKFKKIKNYADENGAVAIALEWNEFQTDIISQLTQQINDQVDIEKPFCFIGSSTGGNFTYQLLEKFTDRKITFVLINPLLNIEQRKIDNHLFTVQLANQLKNPSENLSNGLIILGENDEVLDYNYTYQRLHKNNQIITGKWNHTLSNLETDSFIELIQSFIENNFNNNNMIHVIVSYTVNPEFVTENKKNISVFLNDFKQLDQSRFNYAVFLNDDGITFTHVSNYKDEQIQNEVLNTPSFLNFQKMRDDSGLNNSHKVQVLEYVGSTHPVL